MLFTRQSFIREEKNELRVGGGLWQQDLVKTIGFLTTIWCEDWTAILGVCDRASTTEANAKEAAKALRREFEHGNDSQQLMAARLWAIMLQNSSTLFIHQCAKSKFLNTVKGLLTSRRTAPVVRDRLLDVLAAAAYASSHESGFCSLWRKVKPAGKPDEGVPLSPDHSMFKPPSPQRSTAPPRPQGIPPPLPPRKPQPLHPQSQTQQQPSRAEREEPSYTRLLNEEDSGEESPVGRTPTPHEQLLLPLLGTNVAPKSIYRVCDDREMMDRSPTSSTSSISSSSSVPSKDTAPICGLRSSLSQSAMQAEIAELQSQNEFLKSEQQRLDSEIMEAKAQSRLQEWLIRWRQQQQFTSSSGSQKHFDHSFSSPRQFSSLTCQSSTPSSSKASTSTHIPFGPDSRSTGSSSSRALGHLGKPPIPPSDHDVSILEAMRLQSEFDKEDRALSAQRTELAKFAQQLFECGICMEDMPDDSIARPDPCGHTFCRECLRGHVTARLDERRFPILCPTCTAGKGKGKEAAGEVSQSLALDLGLADEQYSIWTEMEMVSFSIPLCCQKCRRTMFVARDDHEEAEIIVCPLPDCNHEWCKQCQQSIDPDGPKHSCDGTLELDHLMKQEGWKYCPTCKTPIQRISGCNHMSCITPACNTHFCYICGGLIVKSASRQEINEATSAHFMKNCVLFEVPDSEPE